MEWYVLSDETVYTYESIKYTRLKHNHKSQSKDIQLVDGLTLVISQYNLSLRMELAGVYEIPYDRIHNAELQSYEV